MRAPDAAVRAARKAWPIPVASTAVASPSLNQSRAGHDAPSGAARDATRSLTLLIDTALRARRAHSSVDGDSARLLASRRRQ